MIIGEGNAFTLSSLVDVAFTLLVMGSEEKVKGK